MGRRTLNRPEDLLRAKLLGMKYELRLLLRKRKEALGKLAAVENKVRAAIAKREQLRARLSRELPHEI